MPIYFLKEGSSLFAQLKDEVNNLINEDFGKLVQILYRIDVPEKETKATIN